MKRDAHFHGETAMPRRILIADDSAPTREQLRTLLQADRDFQVDTTGDGRSALESLTKTNYSIFLTDLRMPGIEGMKLVEEVRKHQWPVTVIVMTGFGSIDQAVQAMRLGAYHFLTKPVDPDHLRLVIDRALRERKLLDEVVQLREQLQLDYELHHVLSKSPRMHAMFELIKNVAATTTTVLIEGETGTGKEMVARAIHEASAPQRTGEFVAINCAAVPENLLESELFGHEKGSFTSAIAQRRGRFEQAHGGTLFLDEVGDIPSAMQVKLLRVLQERRFERVGGTTSIEVDVRVIAATNRSLVRMVKQGKFREDLYYRLNVVKIELPPLRERSEDVPLLATHFAKKYARSGEPPRNISPAAMEKLLQHTWPGNIRELENAVERACVTAHGDKIEPADLPPEVLAPHASAPAYKIDLSRPLPDLLREATVELEKQYLRKALKKSRGNVGRCAKICGLSRRSISAKLAEYQINKDEFKREML
jgi:DNA-binding NtrC family response regulator